MRIILIGNYERDGQESMRRFAVMLNSGFNNAGVATETWLPVSFFGIPFKNTNHGLGKWMGYLDKWLLFPILLKVRIGSASKRFRDTHFHICDHSNSPYLAYLPAGKTSITCHDVIAIRAGLGFQDAYVNTSATGKILQKWIFRHLRKARKLAAVSNFTLNQFLSLVKPEEQNARKWIVIYNALNAKFWQMPLAEARILLDPYGIKADRPFILHVGSALRRKNRKALLEMVDKLGKGWNGNICYAGKHPDHELLEISSKLGLEDRLLKVVNPDHHTLVALYSMCYAFIFPSLSEGFGWPVIEAQACGAPVICSNVEPMPEISGDGALHADPFNADKFADAFLMLEDDRLRERVVQAGYKNIDRFSTDTMISNYLLLFYN